MPRHMIYVYTTAVLNLVVLNLVNIYYELVDLVLNLVCLIRFRMAWPSAHWALAARHSGASSVRIEAKRTCTIYKGSLLRQ